LKIPSGEMSCCLQTRKTENRTWALEQFIERKLDVNKFHLRTGKQTNWFESYTSIQSALGPIKETNYSSKFQSYQDPSRLNFSVIVELA
jgi:hypothetical protein